MAFKRYVPIADTTIVNYGEFLSEDSRYANAFPLPSDIGLRPTDGDESATPAGTKKKPKKELI